MSTFSEAARPWRMCSAPSARQIRRPKIRQTFRRSSVSSAASRRSSRARTNQEGLPAIDLVSSGSLRSLARVFELATHSLPVQVC